MRVLVCGDRNWIDYDKVYRVLKAMAPKVKLVIQGGAKGADTHGKQAAIALRLPWVQFDADWETHGKAAGPIRNQEMLDKAKPTLVLAFHSDPELGRGTRDMVHRALKAKIPVRIFPDDLVVKRRLSKSDQRIVDEVNATISDGVRRDGPRRYPMAGRPEYRDLYGRLPHADNCRSNRMGPCTCGRGT